MRSVLKGPFDISGHAVQALVWYGDDDLVKYWDLVYNGVNISRLQVEQAEKFTGWTWSKLQIIAMAIQRKLDAEEGRL